MPSLVMPRPVPSSYPLEPLRGCMLYADFQDAGGKIIDHSGRGNHGTNYGSIAAAGPTGIVRSLDGVDDYIHFPLSGVTDPDHFTIEIWLTLPANSTSELLTKYASGGAEEYELWCAAAWGFTDMPNAETAGDYFVGGEVVGSWYCLVGVKDGSNLVAYLNGSALSITTSGATTSVTDGGYVRVAKGSQAGGLNAFKVGLLAIYNRALTAVEVQEAYRCNAWRFGRSG